ncbi:Lpg1974 family pore-forming outer membrane protein [Anatilimnocola floriformis]|uniref:Lpg1974 family pore-forming outer membrane protein n=1 Tax=Anatilimnocola floriformis TaxID=2948575 RepID=UPI0020C43F1B|nr:Lpg1974 family pore-forming outer membrane protein [Anatilimnocola floriformis]
MRFTKLWILAVACTAVLMMGQLSMAQMGGAPPMGPPPGGGGFSCGDGMCGGGCDSCGDDCGWSNRWNVFGEFLYLRARDAETAYASIIDGPIVAGAPGLQAGRTGVLDYDYQPGFRIGGGFTLDNCNQIQVMYSQLDATSNDTITTAAPDVIRGLVLHPNSANAGANFLDANANGELRFNILDIAYRGLLASCSDYEVGYLVGVRSTRLEQYFQANFNNVGTETVTSNVDFDGVGMRFGMDFERYGRNRQWFVYGKGYASLIGGRFQADYLQSSQADPVVATTSWEAGRVVTMLDLETGLGWQSCSGNIRLSVGYLYSGWFNTIRNNEWIHAVQNNDFVATGMSTYDSSVTFDGLTARVELLW